MSYSVSDLKNELVGVLHGTTLNQVQGLDVLINRAARKLLNDCDPLETVRIQQLQSQLFDSVYDYPLPDDVKDDRVIDIRPQVNRTVGDQFTQSYNQPFDVSKTGALNFPEFTIQWNSAVKSVRIAKDVVGPLLVNGATAVTGSDGTWAGGADATDLRTDTLNYVYGSGSVRFDVTGSGTTAYVENSTMTPVDLSRDYQQGSEFMYFFMPDSSQVTSVTLRWGSSASDYWERTVTKNQFSNSFQDGWNLLQFEWNGAAEAGSPDYASVSYLRLSFVYDGTENFDYRVNAFASQLGAIYEIEYYSKFLFRDAETGAFQENVTDDSNVINLDVTSYNVLFSLVAYFVAQQVQGADSSFDAAYFKGEYDQGLARYVAKIRSQVIKPRQQYYVMTTPRSGVVTRYSSS